MKPLVPYLFFNGNCREALNFYKDCLGGGLEIITYADAPPEAMENCSSGAKAPDTPPNPDHVMHGTLGNGDMMIMASDNPSDNTATGDNIQININCDSLEHHQKLFDKLSAGGEVVFQPHDAFWGARFAMLVDKFGIHWMLNFQKDK